MTYCYASLGPWDLGAFRLLGVGLGNLLFPWARCIVVARRHGLTPIAPTWLQIKPGAILRNEPDKRLYWDLFDRPRDYVSGLAKIRLLARLPRVEEAEYLVQQAAPISRAVDSIVMFRGMNGFFSPIIEEHELVWRELLHMTRVKHKAGLGFDFVGDSITVHVRLGDFKLGRQTTELDWFVETIRELRSHLGEGTRVHIFSDGTDEELRPILDLGGAGRLSFGSSVADILALSRSRVLLASARSTFSMWASYLGRMPIVWPGSALDSRLYYDQPELEISREPGAALPSAFLQACKNPR